MAGQTHWQTHNFPNTRALRYLVKTDLKLIQRESTIYDGLNLAISNVLHRLLEIFQSRPDRSHDALLIHNHGDGMAPKVMLFSCMIPNEDEVSPPPKRADPPDTGIHGLPPADAFEDDVDSLTIGVVPNGGGYSSPIHGPIDGKVGSQLESLAALGLRSRHNADLGNAVDILEQLDQAESDAVAPVHEAALRISLVHAAHLGSMDGRRDATANGSGIDHIQTVRQDDGIPRRRDHVFSQPAVGNEPMLGLQGGTQLLLSLLAPAAALGPAPDVVVVHDALTDAIGTDVGSDGRDDPGRLVAER
mmetsp:Transcript_28466/g.66823  ORF Transcript_28466/g.66823 Transcript_28466/m.66823 type:complete len:303 (+) Transcript_28466:956-1864(+)